MTHLTWQTPEYHHTHKSQDWYWTVGIISAALIATSAIFGNFLFAIVLSIGAFSLAMFASRPPRIVTITISDKGVSVDRTLYPFNGLSAFGITDMPSGARLNLKSKKPLMPLIAIMMPDELMDDVRDALSKKLPEEPMEAGIFETLLERLGF